MWKFHEANKYYKLYPAQLDAKLIAWVYLSTSFPSNTKYGIWFISLQISSSYIYMTCIHIILNTYLNIRLYFLEYFTAKQ